MPDAGSVEEMVTWAAISVSVGSVIVPVAAAYDVIKHKRPSGNLLLYGLLFAQALLWVVYGYITHRTPILFVNALYATVTAAYLAAYAGYACDRKIRVCVGTATLGLVLFIGCCSVLPNRDIQVFILGSSATALSALLSFAPLKEVAEVIRKESLGPEYPIGLALTGLLGSCMWGICAVFMRSLPYLISNMVSLTLCALQVAVYLLYGFSDTPLLKTISSIHSPDLYDGLYKGN